MTDIKPGAIGVNTASDDQTLLLVLDVKEHVLLARPLTGQGEHIFPKANFWPLLTKLNGV